MSLGPGVPGCTSVYLGVPGCTPVHEAGESLHAVRESGGDPVSVIGAVCYWAMAILLGDPAVLVPAMRGF